MKRGVGGGDPLSKSTKPRFYLQNFSHLIKLTLLTIYFCYYLSPYLYFYHASNVFALEKWLPSSANHLMLPPLLLLGGHISHILRFTVFSMTHEWKFYFVYSLYSAVFRFSVAKVKFSRSGWMFEKWSTRHRILLVLCFCSLWLFTCLTLLECV